MNSLLSLDEAAAILNFNDIAQQKYTTFLAIWLTGYENIYNETGLYRFYWSTVLLLSISNSDVHVSLNKKTKQLLSKT